MAGVGGVVKGRGERGRQGNNRQMEKREKERERESLCVCVIWCGSGKTNTVVHGGAWLGSFRGK
jgi:hypothetical protein